MSPEVISMREPEEPTVSERVLLSSGRYVSFGPFRIDQQRQEVTRSGSRLKLQGKVYQVLLALLEKPGEVVTREELRIRLWPADTHVNYDANVNTTVNKLRQALGDSSDKPLYIETIPRKGYCLLAQPEVTDAPLKRASPRTTHLRIPFKAPFERRVPCRFQNQMFGLSSAQSASFWPGCSSGPESPGFGFLTQRLRFLLP
jgi:DNA-binding winged helix-turn-helix (wHTH) protein